MESLRQILVAELGEKAVLEEGLQIYTGLDIEMQKAAQAHTKSGLRDLDKRQGYRGAQSTLTDENAIHDFLLEQKNKLTVETTLMRVIKPDGTFTINKKELNLSGIDKEGNPLPVFPNYFELNKIVKGLVTDVNDKWGLVTVQVAETKGIIDISTMTWARKPDTKVRVEQAQIKKPSEALKKGDVIYVEIAKKEFSSSRINTDLVKLKRRLKKNYKRPSILPDFKNYVQLYLQQEPIVQGALVSFDQKTQDIVALVGGYDFEKSQFNRAYQAARQTGSSFKPIVYAAALDKPYYTPATPIMDAPIVYEEDIEEEGQDGTITKSTKIWKPTNHSKHFRGDILFRNAIIKSLNVPTIKIIERIGVEWPTDYARRLGVFSKLNPDFTMALGSSSLTLYEMTKVFSQFGRLGKKISPVLIHKVLNRNKEQVMDKLSLDYKFLQNTEELEAEYEVRRQAYLAFKRKFPDGIHFPDENKKHSPFLNDDEKDKAANADDLTPQIKKIAKEPPLYFNDPDQLLKPQTAFLTTSLLQAVIHEGTGQRALSLKRPVAGKTGTTNGYFDGWFIGYTPQISTGVWVGFDNEQTLGIGEVGGKVALPIWLNYMSSAHKDLPIEHFKVPSEIVFVNIDNKTGKLASSESKKVVSQAFVEGTQPTEISGETSSDNEQDFYKEELNN